jgi:16S rRNA (adenine1518-N6/adenine1519-N6)-dimethyltransferase
MSNSIIAKKRFGQHFLNDSNIIDSIAHGLGAQPKEKIIEIGPGTGALTQQLLKRDLDITALEIDRDLIGYLKKEFFVYENFSVLEANILKTDIASLGFDQPVKIIGNLPYNISSPIIFHLLSQLPNIEEMYFMLQKEVVDRICASPGTKQYGRPSVVIQRVCHVQSELVIPPEAFSPPPKVMSAMIRLRPLEKPLGSHLDSMFFEKFVATAFSQRRKTLRNTIGKLVSKEEFLTAQIDSSRRAETLSIEEFITLASFHRE